jgi:hypothetical protein
MPGTAPLSAHRTICRSGATMELAGLEPATSWVRSRRSPKLSYSPVEHPIIDSGRAPAGTLCNPADNPGAAWRPALTSARCTASMGSLDDAIREHLELKRQHGASDEELKQQEDEAFGRRRPAAESSSPQDDHDDPLAPDDLTAPDELEAAEPQANGQPAEAPSEPAATFEPEPFEPDEVPAEEALEPELKVRDAREEPPPVWDAAESEDGDEDAARSGDPLEETPEFLEESEEDRLWFEQRPPKDFDFD